MTMDRRSFIKIAGIGAVAAAALPAQARAEPEPHEEMVELGPEVGAKYFGGKPEEAGDGSPLTAILFTDHIPAGYKPSYEADVRSRAHAVASSWNRAGEKCRVVVYRELKKNQRSVVLPLYPRPETDDLEDLDVVNLLEASANAPHTITATGGAFTQTALTQACRILEAHGIIPSALVIHPELILTLGGFDPLGEDEEYEDLVLKEHVQKYTMGDDEYEQEEHHPARRLKVLTSRNAPRWTAFLTAQPEYVGVRAKAYDGKQAMAILNDYSVIKINVVGDDEQAKPQWKEMDVCPKQFLSLDFLLSGAKPPAGATIFTAPSGSLPIFKRKPGVTFVMDRGVPLEVSQGDAILVPLIDIGALAQAGKDADSRSRVWNLQEMATAAHKAAAASGMKNPWLHLFRAEGGESDEHHRVSGFVCDGKTEPLRRYS